MFAKVAFFYGWSHAEIGSMAFDDLLNYWRAISIIEAQEMLKSIQVGSYPHADAKYRKKLERELRQQAYNSIDTGPKKASTFGDFAKKMALRMNNG